MQWLGLGYEGGNKPKYLTIRLENCSSFTLNIKQRLNLKYSNILQDYNDQILFRLQLTTSLPLLYYQEIFHEKCKMLKKAIIS